MNFWIVIIVIIILIILLLWVSSKPTYEKFSNNINGPIDVAMNNNHACECPGVSCNIKFNPAVRQPSVPKLFDTFNRNLALFCANLLLNKNSSNVTNMELVAKINLNDDNVGVIWYSSLNQILYIVFYGKNNWYHPSTNSQVEPKFLPREKWDEIDEQIDQPTNCLDTKNVVVNEEFYQAYMKIRKDLFGSLENINISTIILTGHDFGAALATLAAADICHQYSNTINDVKLYTFGAPRVGNTAFVYLMKYLRRKNLVHYYQVRNEDDIVPNYPSSVCANFDDENSPFIYEHAGSIVSIRRNWLSVHNNHSLSLYINELKNERFSVYFIW